MMSGTNRRAASIDSATVPARVPLSARVATLAAMILPFLGLVAALILLWGWGFGWIEFGLLLGMYVLTAEHGGSFRESFALAKAYAEARQQHGESEVLDAVVGEKPKVDRHRYGTPDALRTDGV